MCWRGGVWSYSLIHMQTVFYGDGGGGCGRWVGSGWWWPVGWRRRKVARGDWEGGGRGWAAAAARVRPVCPGKVGFSI